MHNLNIPARIKNVDEEIEKAKRRLHRMIDGTKAPVVITGSGASNNYKVMVGEYEVTGVTSLEFEIHPRVHQPVLVIKVLVENINIKSI